MYETKSIGSIQANADSAVVEIGQYADKWLLARGLSAGSAAVKLSIDGTNYVTAMTINADGWYELPWPATHIKLTGSGLTLTAADVRADNPATGR